MWIGERKIKGAQELGDKVLVMFKDNSDITINKNLFDIIQSEEKKQGLITDVVRHVLSTKYLSDMADYGLDFGMTAHIGQGIQTLAHNLRESAIGKKFNCAGANEIPLKDLLDE